MLLTSPFPTHMHACPHARMHVQWQQQQKHQQQLHPFIRMQLWPNSGPLQHCNWAIVSILNVHYCSTPHYIHLKRKTIGPAYEKLPLIE